MAIALKELLPFVRDGRHLLTGKPFINFDQARSRELWGNFLCCAAINSITSEGRLTFTSDPTGGDGIILDTITGESWPTEHVMVPTIREGGQSDIRTLILESIDAKRKNGKAYASGKTLIVFLNSGGGEWHPNAVAKALPDPLLFEAVWIWGFQETTDDKYIYAVTRLDLRLGNAPTWRVTINLDAETWTVKSG